jgi:A/G-specific adenine glycosylase
MPKTAKDSGMRSVTPSRQTLLAWYDRHRRDLPWRARFGERADPYRVWLSEVMLQQTTVATVRPRYDAFLSRWPTVADLAAAPLDDVLGEWAGLGYYARARNLHACAREVAAKHGGEFPDTEPGLASLPGIGAYTAAAVAAIAFDQPATVVDGNVERVVARLNALEEPVPAAKPLIRMLADELFRAGKPERPGDFAQALMDLGATVCVPARPRCEACPWARDCLGLARGVAHELPRRQAKGEKPQRHGVHFWLTDAEGRLLLHRRPERGLLGGMLELPVAGKGWQVGKPDHAALLKQAGGLPGRWQLLPGSVGHSFTHFDLTVRIAVQERPELELLATNIPDWRWLALGELEQAAIPSVTAKMIRHALQAQANALAPEFELEPLS